MCVWRKNRGWLSSQAPSLWSEFAVWAKREGEDGRRISHFSPKDGVRSPWGPGGAGGAGGLLTTRDGVVFRRVTESWIQAT